jgi:UDP-glucose 4-epimerase
MRYLVTGGTGFLGSHIVQTLIAGAHDVTVLSRTVPATGSDAARRLQGARVHPGDIRDASSVASALRGIEVVMHFAGAGSPASPPEAFADIIDINVIGTEIVLHEAVRAGVLRFVQASSASVYGDVTTSPIGEETIPNPKSVYATSKLVAERICAAARQAHEIQATNLRFFNVYGPGQDPDGRSDRVVPRFIRAIRAGEPVTIFGGGNQVRDFIHVTDAAAVAMRCSLRNDLPAALNVCSGIGVTIHQLLGWLEDAMAVPVPVNDLPARTGDIVVSIGDTTLLESTIGPIPVRATQQGIAELLAEVLGTPVAQLFGSARIG